MSDLYKPAQIAEVVGFSPQTVRAYLRQKFPSHQNGEWWKLEREEYDFAIAEMRAAAAVMPRQPLRVLRRPQKILVFF